MTVPEIRERYPRIYDIFLKYGSLSTPIEECEKVSAVIDWGKATEIKNPEKFFSSLTSCKEFDAAFFKLVLQEPHLFLRKGNLEWSTEYPIDSSTFKLFEIFTILYPKLKVPFIKAFESYTGKSLPDKDSTFTSVSWAVDHNGESSNSPFWMNLNHFNSKNSGPTLLPYEFLNEFDEVKKSETDLSKIKHVKIQNWEGHRLNNRVVEVISLERNNSVNKIYTLTCKDTTGLNPVAGMRPGTLREDQIKLVITGNDLLEEAKLRYPVDCRTLYGVIKPENEVDHYGPEPLEKSDNSTAKIIIGIRGNGFPYVFRFNTWRDVPVLGYGPEVEKPLEILTHSLEQAMANTAEVTVEEPIEWKIQGGRIPIEEPTLTLLRINEEEQLSRNISLPKSPKAISYE